MTQYSDLVHKAMKSDKDAGEWFERLKEIQNRRAIEREKLKIGRAKHPGLTNFEILKATV